MSRLAALIARIFPSRSLTSMEAERKRLAEERRKRVILHRPVRDIDARLVPLTTDCLRRRKRRR